ncbi:hypothetical protein HDV00_001080 [Rhizophlyctis rosea]|nr:hypothetical protein HDV00_001080 [Rhizophlyctis rosea]
MVKEDTGDNASRRSGRKRKAVAVDIHPPKRSTVAVARSTKKPKTSKATNERVSSPSSSLQPAAMPSIPTLPLRNGTSTANLTIPQLGFGTYRLKKDAVTKPLRSALNLGYPLLDTASVYDNEKQIGQLLSSLPATTPTPFITTKLWRSHQGTPQIITSSVSKSLRALQTPHINLYLLHWPGPGAHRFKKHQVPHNWTPQMRIETWKTLTTFLSPETTAPKSSSKTKPPPPTTTTPPKCHAIGVSNFTIRHLQELKQHSPIIPAVNQIECHPFLPQKDLRAYCKREGIIIMAYCSLGEGNKKLLTHPVVTEIAGEAGKTPAQVLLRWGVEHGMVVIPCSTQEGHQRENMDIFEWELGAERMGRLDGLECGVRYGWKGVDPEDVP